MQENLGLRRKARAVIAALLILAATALAMPSTASAAHGRGWGGYRVARHSYGRVAYRPHYRSFYGYRPYYVSYYRPRYRTVVFDDPYCDDDPYYVVRPVYRTYYHHRPRVGVSLVFGNGGGYGYYGDPYCGW